MPRPARAQREFAPGQLPFIRVASAQQLLAISPQDVLAKLKFVILAIAARLCSLAPVSTLSTQPAP